MIAAVHTGWNLVYEHRQDIFFYLITSSLVSFYSKKTHGREEATLVDLSLHGRLTDVSFTKWLASITTEKTLEEAQSAPKYLLLKTHMLEDLSRKLILPTILIALSYLSPEKTTLTTVLRNLLSHSTKVSKIALPILNQITEHPRLASLLNLNIIVCAPVVAKLIHMALIYLNADQNHRYEAFKNFVGHVTKGLEIFSNLTFTLYNLGLSTTFCATIATTIYSLAVELFSSFQMGKDYEAILKAAPPFISHYEILKNPDNSWINYLIHLVCYYDANATNGVWLGLHALWASVRASSEPYKGEKLIEIFQAIENFNPSIKDYAESISKSQKQINNALKSRAISENHAKELQTLLYEKSKSLLNTIAQNVLLFELRDIPVQIEQILTILNELKTKKMISDDQYFDLKTVVKAQLKAFYNEKVLGKSGVAEETLDNNNKSPFDFEKYLLKGENEKHLTSLFGSEGLFNRLALDKNKSLGDDYFVSLKFHFDVFNTNFNWYLQNQSYISEKEKCEFMLLAQAIYAQVNPKSLLKTNAILKGLNEKNQELIKKATDAPNKILLAFAESQISSIEELKYMRSTNVSPIPARFQFATYSLPFLVGKLRKVTNSSVNTWPLTNHLPNGVKEKCELNIVPPYVAESLTQERKDCVFYINSNQIRALKTS